LRAIARVLAGEVSGQRVLAPGPQHSPKDRSLCVSLAPTTPSGFLVHSFAGDDPIQCKDYVRARLGLPAWQPGNEQDRRVHLSRIKDLDRTIADGHRSLCVSLAPATPSGFRVHTLAGDDPIQCKDYVRARLGLPAWQPGNEQDRRVHLSRIKDLDRTIADGQATLREKTEDDLLRIKRAQALWNDAAGPRGTTAVQYLMSRALDLPDDLAGALLRFHPRCPWRDEDTGRTERIPALLAAFRSIHDHSLTAVH